MGCQRVVELQARVHVRVHDLGSGDKKSPKGQKVLQL
jgi:hypothetical protein